MKRIVLLLASLLLLLPMGGVLASPIAPEASPTAQQELPLPDLFDTVAQSVVSISVLTAESGFGGDFLAQSSGSGFVVDMQGHIVTNNHVVDEAQDIVVSFLDGTRSRATVVGTDPDSDLAVIRVEVDPAILRPVIFGDSSVVRIGQDVIALGNPFGQNWTMTRGIVSAVGRSNPAENGFSIAEMIQTDAAINPGNSGGPLFNRRGEVVGVNTMIFSETAVNSGIGFAVPSNTVQRVYPVLITEGDYDYTWLGIRAGGDGITLDEVELMGLDPSVRGVLVGQVIGNSPAARAQLRGNNDTGTINGRSYNIGGDVIVGINGEPILAMSDLVGYLAENTRPGDNIVLNIIRDGQPFEVRVILDARPQ